MCQVFVSNNDVRQVGNETATDSSTGSCFRREVLDKHVLN